MIKLVISVSEGFEDNVKLMNYEKWQHFLFFCILLKKGGKVYVKNF